MLRIALSLGLLTVCGCGLAGRVIDEVVDQNRAGELQTADRRAEQQEQVEAMLQRHQVPEADEMDAAYRLFLQEWLDHEANAWLPVALLSDVVTRWPRGVVVETIEVTQSELTIRAVSADSAALLVSGLDGSAWTGQMSNEGSVVSAKMTGIDRKHAPETVDAVEAMVQDLSHTHVLGPSLGVEERNSPLHREGVAGVFNCWDKSASSPAVHVGEWAALDWVQSGTKWSRLGATVDLKGDFVSVVKGLDCARASNWRLSVQSLEFKVDTESPGDVVATVVVALMVGVTAYRPADSAPWSTEALWGSAPQPERKRILENSTLFDPFSH